MQHIELGKHGENLALNYLQKQSYQILAQNYRCQHLELDIVAQKNNKLIVIEVKTRNSIEFGLPWQAVTIKKQKQIIKATNAYILEFNIQEDVQFDIISIIVNANYIDLEHLEDAFSP